jgi:hypothetical protein
LFNGSLHFFNIILNAVSLPTDSFLLHGCFEVIEVCCHASGVIIDACCCRRVRMHDLGIDVTVEEGCDAIRRVVMLVNR